MSSLVSRRCSACSKQVAAPITAGYLTFNYDRVGNVGIAILIVNTAPPEADLAVAHWLHHTSRDGDMQRTRTGPAFPA